MYEMQSSVRVLVGLRLNAVIEIWHPSHNIVRPNNHSSGRESLLYRCEADALQKVQSL